MPSIFRGEDVTFSKAQPPIPEFAMGTGPEFSRISGSKHLVFDIRSLSPGKYSFPYHFHNAAEELFYIISGQATLRIPDGFTKVGERDLIFFEEGETSAHQLFNHSEAVCIYLDIRTVPEVDICEYPDSGKVNIIAHKGVSGVFDKSSRVSYYKGEEGVADKWPEDTD